MASSIAVTAHSTTSVLPPMLHIRVGAGFRHHHSDRQLNYVRVHGLATSSVLRRSLSAETAAPGSRRRAELRAIEKHYMGMSDGEGFSPDGRVQCRSVKISCSSAAGSAGSQPSGSDESPYQVLGVKPFENFDSIKAVYTRRHRDAEKRGDEAAMARLEGAYDQLLMSQLRNRKQGRTIGDFEVSKEIKYADKQAWFPWAPKAVSSSRNDILINLAGSAVIAIWMYVSQQADWKPLQFLLFGYAWRIFMKLENVEPSASSFSEEEDEDRNAKRRQKNGKRLLRTLAFVFGTVAITSLAFTGILNGYELLGLYIPRAVMNSQELFVTISSSVLLFFAGSYFR